MIIRTFQPDIDISSLLLEVNDTIFHAEGLKKVPCHTLQTEHLLLTFVAFINEKPVGHCALYHNPLLRLHDKTTFLIGAYKCINNTLIAKTMIAKVLNIAKKEGAKYLIGPMEGSTWNNYRFRLNSNMPYFLMEPQNPVYYNKQFMNMGFEVLTRYTSSIDHSLICNTPEIMQLDKQFADSGIKIKPLSIKILYKTLSRLYPFIQRAFASNFLFTPVSKEQFINKYMKTKPLIDPDFALYAETKDQQIVGFLFAYENPLHRTGKQLVIKTLARNPGNEYRGLGMVLSNRVIEQAQKRGFDSIIHALMIENATSTRTSQQFAGSVFTNYALYFKTI